MLNTYSKAFLKEILNNFPSYLTYVYHHINLPDPTPLQYRIATHLNENPSRLILEAARGVGKSWILAIYSTWRLLRNPNEKILVVSASSPKANEIAVFIRSLFDNVPILNPLRPTKGQRDSVLSFDVNGADVSIAPSVSSIGVTGQITGKRASLILADDVEVPNNSATETLRQKLIERVREFEALLIPDLPSSIIFAGTPQSMESIYAKLDYPTIILPAQVPEKPELYEGKLDEWVLEQGEAGTPTDKVRFPLEVLLERKAGIGEVGYKLQYMLDTTLSDAEKYPLKTIDLMVLPLTRKEAPVYVSYTRSPKYGIDELPNIGFTGDRFQRPFDIAQMRKHYELVLMSIDPSGSGADETTFAVLGLLNGNIFVLDFGGTRAGYSEEALHFLSKKAKEWDVHLVVPEANFGSGMFTQLLRPILKNYHKCTIVEDFKVKGQKEKRIIDTLAPVVTNHRMIFNEEPLTRELEWVQKDRIANIDYSLVYQLTHITYDRGALTHDDRIDALAIGVQYLQDRLDVRDKELYEKAKEEEMLEWVTTHIYNNPNNRKTSKGNILNGYKFFKS